MKLKFKSGGIIKLQSAGIIPIVRKTISGIKQLPVFYKTLEGFPSKSRFIMPALKDPKLLDDVMKYRFETINVRPMDILRNFDIDNISYTPRQRFDIFKDLDLTLKEIQLPEIERIISDYGKKYETIRSNTKTHCRYITTIFR